MGLGLGGSSADSAGVLKGLAQLYKIDDFEGVAKLADENGSDTRYMLTGGYARLKGRGERVFHIDSKLKLNFLLIAPAEGVSTAECYKTFDKIGVFGGDGGKAEAALKAGDIRALAGSLCNALTIPAKMLSGSVSKAFEDLAAFDPLAVNMTGSGSGVYALFETPEFAAYAKSRYKGKFKVYSLKTI